MSNTYKYVLCISCISGKEAVVAHELESTFDCKVIIAQKVKRLWVDGRWIEQNLPLFRGYVFLYLDAIPDIPVISRFENVLKVLRYSDGDICLQGRDLEFARFLLNIGGTIKPLEAVCEENYIRITDRILQIYQGYVDTVNKRKQIARIAFDFLGDTKYMWLSYVTTGPPKL